MISFEICWLNRILKYTKRWINWENSAHGIENDGQNCSSSIGTEPIWIIFMIKLQNIHALFVRYRSYCAGKLHFFISSSKFLSILNFYLALYSRSSVILEINLVENECSDSIIQLSKANGDFVSFQELCEGKKIHPFINWITGYWYVANIILSDNTDCRKQMRHCSREITDSVPSE